MKNAYAIVDCQYGSTGKGLIAGYLAKRRQPDVVACAFAPNAGHTYIDAAGRKFINRALPNGIISSRLRAVLLGPGSIIDMAILEEETKRYYDLLVNAYLIIHPNAMILDPRHLEEERAFVKIGSTMKGVGAAIIEKVRRGENTRLASTVDWHLFTQETGVATFCDKSRHQQMIREAILLQIEGTQGYSLSIHHGFYPYVTSRDTTTAALLSDSGVPVGQLASVVGTFRTYPIRVANRFDAAGQQIGYSGPCYDDQEEIAWSDIGQEPELTTVTKLPRRLFTFSKKQAVEAIAMNSIDEVYVSHMDYLKTPDAKTKFVDMLSYIARNNNAVVRYLSDGPTERDVTKRYSNV